MIDGGYGLAIVVWVGGLPVTVRFAEKEVRHAIGITSAHKAGTAADALDEP